jgi:hypothetical protein
VRLVVLHTAEGARTYQSLGNYFKGNVGASSHVGIDDTPGVVGEYVRTPYAAWTQASYNSAAVSAELCAFAGWDAAEWSRHPAMLRNAADWVAEECARFGLPIRALSAGEAQGAGRGVCQHADLGSAGGGHWDCGPGFPMADVLAMAAGIDLRPTKRKGRKMLARCEGGYWTTTSDGAVYAFGSARYLGNAMGKVTGEVVGIDGEPDGSGYRLLASDGGLFCFGSPFLGRPDRV